jgi:hypothetical protein
VGVFWGGGLGFFRVFFCWLSQKKTSLRMTGVEGSPGSRAVRLTGIRMVTGWDRRAVLGALWSFIFTNWVG